jgi:hypothetical protein
MRGNIEQFKRTKSINYKMSILSMFITQGILFSFNMSAVANMVAYFLNFFAWIIVGVLLDCFVATYHGINLSVS